MGTVDLLVVVFIVVVVVVAVIAMGRRRRKRKNGFQVRDWTGLAERGPHPGLDAVDAVEVPVDHGLIPPPLAVLHLAEDAVAQGPLACVVTDEAVEVGMHHSREVVAVLHVASLAHVRKPLLPEPRVVHARRGHGIGHCLEDDDGLGSETVQATSAQPRAVFREGDSAALLAFASRGQRGR